MKSLTKLYKYEHISRFVQLNYLLNNYDINVTNVNSTRIYNLLNKYK